MFTKRSLSVVIIFPVEWLKGAPSAIKVHKFVGLVTPPAVPPFSDVITFVQSPLSETTLI